MSESSKPLSSHTLKFQEDAAHALEHTQMTEHERECVIDVLKWIEEGRMDFKEPASVEDSVKIVADYWEMIFDVIL